MTTSTSARLAFGATAVIACIFTLDDLFLPLSSTASREFGMAAFNLAYFTVLSNILVVVTCAILAAGKGGTSRFFALSRLTSLVAITVTFLVFHLVLSPGLAGFHSVETIGMHTVDPVLAVGGWLAFGPKMNLTFKTIWISLLCPLAWLAFTLIRGAASGWYPYGFLDVPKDGAARVTVTCIVLFFVFFGLSLLVKAVDGRRRGTAAPLAATASPAVADSPLGDGSV